MNYLVLVLAATIMGAAAYPSQLQAFGDLVMNRENGQLQQWPPQCSPFDFRITFGTTYVFKYCQANGMGCLDPSQTTPPPCTGHAFCYNVQWSANGQVYNFQICPTFNGACMRGLSLMRCMMRGGDVQEEGPRLCEELPDGTEDCTNIPAAQGHVQELDDEECFCLEANGHKYCEPRGCGGK